MADRTVHGPDGDAGEVTWYFDLVSPFAYLALPGVEALARRRAVRFRPVLFGVLLSRWGQLGPAEVTPKRLCTYRLVQFAAGQAGLKLRFPPRHPFRSLDALRLLVTLDGQQNAVRTAFDFVWAEGHDPSEPAGRDGLCARLGVSDYAAAIAKSGAKERLRNWTEEAAAAGVFGVPTLVVGGELFWGADAMPMAEAYLADPGLFRRGEMARLAGLPIGAERKSVT